MKIFLMIGFAIIATLFVSGCSHSDTTSTSFEIVRNANGIFIPAASPLRGELRCDTVRAAGVAMDFSTPATVEVNPSCFAKVVPPMAGSVAQVHVRLGDFVQAGKPLVTMNAPEFAAATADFIQAEKSLRRERDLKDQGIAATRDVEQAESDYARAAGRLRLMGGSPEQDKSNGPLIVRAPISGRVVDFTVAQGDFRNDLSAPMMIIADLSTVWLCANVPENEIAGIFAGQSVEAIFPAYPDALFHGKVLFVGDLLDQDTRTVKVRIAVPNPRGQFKPGMFATVKFIREEMRAMIVPSSAIVQIRDSSFVFEQTAAWTFTPRAILAGASVHDSTIILRGLAPNAVVLMREGVLLQ